jgi:hypothetical protein
MFTNSCSRRMPRRLGRCSCSPLAGCCYHGFLDALCNCTTCACFPSQYSTHASISSRGFSTASPRDRPSLCPTVRASLASATSRGKWVDSPAQSQAGAEAVTVTAWTFMRRSTISKPMLSQWLAPSQSRKDKSLVRNGPTMSNFQRPDTFHKSEPCLPLAPEISTGHRFRDQLFHRERWALDGAGRDAADAIRFCAC